jgi:segregation and condensation protein A
LTTPKMDGAADSNPPSNGGSGPPAPLQLKLDVFEGPLDLLLHLIRKSEIDVTDIPIIEVTKQYMEYLDFMKQLDLGLAGDYLVMAATLIHIKSKMLLPPEPVEDEEEVEDPRAELVRQLLEYEKFQQLAEDLRERRQVEQASYPSGAPPEFETEDELLVKASLFDLVAAFKELLEQSGKPEVMEIETYRISVADRLQELIELVTQAGNLDFHELFVPEGTKHEWIATFLALLELARLQMIRIVHNTTTRRLGIVRREPEETDETHYGSTDS